MRRLISIDGGRRVQVLSRPSQVNKSPYLADVRFHDGNVCMAHAPSLGVGGLVNTGAFVWVIPAEGNGKRVSKWVVYLAEAEAGIYLGVLPLSANAIALEVLKKNYVKQLSDLIDIRPETRVGESRFDMTAKTKDNKRVIIEVKSVNGYNRFGRTLKPAEARRGSSGKDIKPCIAFFPEGSRSGKKGNTVSPRALRHLEQLANIKTSHPEDRCVMLYVVQRDGCDAFAVNVRDPVYHRAFQLASKAGVEMIAISVRWNPKGCVYRKELPIMLMDY